MAQALSVVGEQGIHGMKYNGLIEAWANNAGSRQSRRFRVSMRSAYSFSGREFENYMILAARFGLVERSKFKERNQKPGLDKTAYDVEDEIVKLTREGWEFIEKHDVPLMHKWATNISENVPSIFVSVVTALLIAYATSLLKLAG